MKEKNEMADHEHELVNQNRIRSTDGNVVFSRKNIITSIFLLLANCILIPGIWKFLYFNVVDMSSLIFQLKMPLAGADTSNFHTLFLWMFFGGFGALAIEWLALYI